MMEDCSENGFKKVMFWNVFIDRGSFMDDIETRKDGNSMDRDFVQQRFKELKRERVYPSGRWLVAKMPNVTKYMIQKILGGEIYDAEDRRIFQLILAQIGVSEDQFFHGNPPASLASKPAAFSTLAPTQVPVFGIIPAGHASSSGGVAEPEEWIDPPPGVKNKKLFALRVSGQSMAPRLLPGDLVFLEQIGLGFGYKNPESPAPRASYELYNGRIVAALIDGESSLKVLKLVPKKDSMDFDLFLVPINPAFPERFIQPDECFELQGVVHCMVRDETLPAMSFKELQ
jgi:SOS-response transcriptional repressor LexA